MKTEMPQCVSKFSILAHSREFGYYVNINDLQFLLQLILTMIFHELLYNRRQPSYNLRGSRIIDDCKLDNSKKRNGMDAKESCAGKV